ncbi:hypothetical protein FML20_13365 [Klebsiella michiganensis]|nr:hypothetical protein [Klebsiella michiganensis]
MTISEFSIHSNSEPPHTGHSNVIFLLYLSALNLICFHSSYSLYLVTGNIDGINVKVWTIT